MRLINSTPHALTIVDGQDHPVLTIAPSGDIARVVFKDLGQTQVEVDGLEVAINLGKQATDVIGVPEPHDGVLVVVSRVVKAALPHRGDIVVPDDLVRNRWAASSAAAA
ncbi:hypothetical protein [Actinomyces gaoshouyii]|uniref:hypothetical protein n=1 Tax=Actinomyces gaoshouyii TaxID=1960083 RepID=UPI0009C0467E|nr:hypothetical protein [Actinomyces gaoshouyii]ARD42493.1 hypothetical protein B6G06_09195 [Actinomyces gaoshouyii]